MMKKVRNVGKHILIIPQGWTEYFYANSLKANLLPRDIQRNVTIEIPKPSGKNQAMVLFSLIRNKQKEAIRAQNPFDQIWVVLDNDNQPDIRLFLENAIKHHIKPAYSCICIEHWFILHLEDCRKAFASAKEALNYLQPLWETHLGTPYLKKGQDHYRLLQDKTPVAMERARQIEKYGSDQPIYKRNPYFTNHHFIDFFIQLAKSTDPQF